MANGVDVFLGGLRSAGTGAVQGRQIANQTAQRERQEEEFRKKQEADQIRKARLQEVSGQVGQILQRAQEDEAFDQTAFATSAQPVIEASIELGDPGILDSLGPIQNIITQRQATQQAKLKAGAERAKTTADLAKEKKKDDKDLRKEIRTIGAEHRQDKTTARTSIMREAFGRIRKAADVKNPSAANDLSMIFNFMKTLDPESTVRESEFRSAANARAAFEREYEIDENGNAVNKKTGKILPSRFTQFLQKLDPDQKGSFLTPTQKASFLATAKDNYRSQLENQRGVDERTMENLRAIDPERADEFSKRVFKSRAADELTAFDEEDAQGNTAAAADEGSQVGADAENSNIQFVDETAFQAIVAKHADQFEQRIATYEQRAGRQVTKEERQELIIEIMKNNNIHLQMKPPPGAL